MKILLVNYRYFVSGGPERYMFNVKELLEKHGHTVIPFSVKCNKNVPTEYEKYFVDPIGDKDAVYYDEVKKTPKSIMQLLGRSIYSFEVKKAIQREIKAEKPDLVYIIHFVNKLSPSVITGAKELGVPVVLRLSDYFMLCPRFDFLCNGKVCEDCTRKGYMCCIKNRCVKGSLAASVIRVFSMKVHRLLRVYDKVDAFITPSLFLKKKLIGNGVNRRKIVHIPTFTNSPAEGQENVIGEYGLYFGRITKEKGVETVVKAYEKMPDKKLVIMGDADTPEGIKLKKYVKDHNLDNISFIGFKSGTELEDVIRNARFTIIPSIWYDNLPNTALESFKYGKPVIASRIGSLPELVKDGVNGLLFEPGNVDALVKKIEKMSDGENVKNMGNNGHNIVTREFADNRHYNYLISLFKRIIK